MTTADASLRQERLAENLQGVRASRGNIFTGDRWMLVVGGTLLPLGMIVVLLGWLGASNSVLVFEQIPYMISGGLLGLCLVFAGGFVYFAYWMTVMVRENRLMRADLVSVLGRMELLLQDGAMPGSAPRTGSRTALVATSTGSMIHRADCVAVDKRDGLRPVTAKTKGLTPCRLCDPLADAS